MKNFTCLFLFLTLFISSCEKTEDFNDSEDLSFQLIENHKEIKGKVFSVTANENCGKIYVSARIDGVDGQYANVFFTLLSNGELESVKYNADLPAGQNLFYTQAIEPKKSFSIEDFKYDRQSQTASFKFKGKVFGHTNAKAEMQIEGSVHAKDIESLKCDAIIFDIRTTDPKFNFFSITSSTSKTHFVDKDGFYDYYYKSLSNSGQHLRLRLEKGIANYLDQEIELDEENKKNWVEYMEYTGPFVVNLNVNIIPSEWKKYKVKGKIQSLKKHSNPPDVFGKYFEGYMVLDIYDKEKIIVENAVLPFEVKDI